MTAQCLAIQEMACEIFALLNKFLGHLSSGTFGYNQQPRPFLSADVMFFEYHEYPKTTKLIQFTGFLE